MYWFLHDVIYYFQNCKSVNPSIFFTKYGSCMLKVTKAFAPTMVQLIRKNVKRFSIEFEIKLLSDRGLQLTRNLLSQEFLRETPDVFRLPSWFGWPVRNIHFTDDNGYLPTVMNTNPFLYRLWLTSIVTLYTGFDYWVTRRVPLVEQELLTLPEHLKSPSFL